MENKINVAELLKDCPKGMELDCALFDVVKFEECAGDYIYICLNNGELFALTKYGSCIEFPISKCVIFPKGKTTWEGFIPPCKFKDGDVVAAASQLFLLKHLIHSENANTHNGDCYFGWDFHRNALFEKGKWEFTRLATEEEKQKLFDAIKANGYKWNEETKTLEELQKFKIGDIIKDKCNVKWKVIDVNRYYYEVSLVLTGTSKLLEIKSQNDYELVPNKFDITTLVPFESRVLVREDKTDVWRPTFYGFFHQHSKRFYTTSSGTWLMCIPCNEDTKHLTGTTNDCDDFYKTWE